MEGGWAVARPAQGESFDPAPVAAAIRDAGFTPREVVVTAVGSLRRAGDGWLLAAAEPPGEIRLEVGEDVELPETPGRVRLTGKLVSSGREQLTVRVTDWESLAP